MKLFLGIDMAKNDFICAIESEDHALKQPHPKLTNNPRSFNQLKLWVNKQAGKARCDTVHLGIESTGGYEKTLVKWFRSHTDYLITVLNPVQVKRFAQSQLVRTKTDQVDARLIAHYMTIHNPDPTAVLPQEVEQLKALTRHLEHLTRKRADEMAYLEKVGDAAVLTSVKQTINSYSKQIEKIEKRIKDHFDNHPDLKANRDLLKTIPGIGDTTSAILLSEMLTILEPKQQVAHAGLAPRERQSGLLRGKTQLCKTGNSRIRTALYLPTLSAIRCNPVITAFYERLLSRGKPRMVAVGACMRKMLHLATGVLKTQTDFSADYEKLTVAT